MVRWNKASLQCGDLAYGRGQQLTIGDFPAVISDTSPNRLVSQAMLLDGAIRGLDQPRRMRSTVIDRITHISAG
jgi:hypothetical protein